jgi:uncharacterized membrane protein
MFIGLNDLPGGAGGDPFLSRAFGISADGQVVTGQGFSTSGLEGFTWTQGGGLVAMGDLAGGLFASVGRAASADGAVISGAMCPTGCTFGGANAGRWTPGGGWTDLGDFAGGAQLSTANGISADGSILAGWGTSAAGSEAFRWISGDPNGLVSLGDLAGGGSDSFGQAISADGSVVVGQGASASGIEAFRWVSGDPNGMVGLGDLAGGGFASSARGISPDGTVMVGFGTSASGQEAFRLELGDPNGMMGLGDLPGGAFWSRAEDVSGDGSIVVGVAGTGANPDTTIADQEAFIWDEAHGMRLLEDVLVGLGLDLTGWELNQATAISDDGLRIVGFGSSPLGSSEAFLAELPEPSSAALLGLGLAALAALQRARARDAS